MIRIAAFVLGLVAPALALGQGQLVPLLGAGGKARVATAAGSTTTWNPSDKFNTTLSGGNLVATVANSGGLAGVRATVPCSGKSYVEITATTNGTEGFSGPAIARTTWDITSENIFSSGTAGIILPVYNSQINVYGVPQIAFVPVTSSGTIVGIALDATAQKVWFRSDFGGLGPWNGTDNMGDPAAGTGSLDISGNAGPYYIAIGANGETSAVWTAAFSSSGWSYSPPSGFGQC